MNRRQILFFFILFFSSIGVQAQSQFPPSFDLAGDERFPSITSDGKVLLFARESEEGFTFHLSNKIDGKFMPPTTLMLPKDLPYPTGPMISYDGRWIYFSAKGQTSGSDIYRMKRWGRRLGKPEKIEGKVNTSGYEMYPSLTKDGKGLYFSRLDDVSDPMDLKYAIYYSELDSDGKWGEPVKLPEGVNLYSEKEPKILPDSKTLMFTSKISDESFDYDVMMARKNEDGTWSDPEPVLSINQSKLNHPPCIDGVSQKAYFSKEGKLMEIPLNKVIETTTEVKKEVALSRNTDTSTQSDQSEKKETSPAKKPSTVSSFSDLGFDIKDYVPEPKYKAIIIGINTYNDGKIASLDNPEKDASSLQEILTTYYSFGKEDVKLLLSPTRENLIETFDAMMEESSENDHILIFYAGHGHWDQRRKAGYWLPSDAKAKSTANWVRNSTIKEYVASFKAKHVLLISDACFSGSIFKTRAAFDGADKSIKALEDLPSRKAMTSGTLKEVPDESVFVKYLQKRLVSNQEKFISARSLFDSFRVAVMNNSENVPQFGVINQTGDEGGGFIFIRK